VSQGSVVGIAIGLSAGQSKSESQQGQENFFFLQNVQTCSGAQLVLSFSRYGCSFPGGKLAGAGS
jgi:hypothetical protein